VHRQQVLMTMMLMMLMLMTMMAETTLFTNYRMSCCASMY
jgi:hypothetical protein